MMPIAVVPYMIRFGPDTTADALAKILVCKCGWKGAQLMRPSWGGSRVGWSMFPSKERIAEGEGLNDAWRAKQTPMDPRPS